MAGTDQGNDEQREPDEVGRRAVRDERQLHEKRRVARPKKSEGGGGSSDEGGGDKDGDDKNGGKGKKKSRWPIIILIVVGILAVIAAVVYYLMTKDQTSTDDAYTDGNAISIAAKVSGYVVERRVDDNNFIKAGQPMIQIDPRDYVNARDQAQGALDLARAQLTSAEIDLQIARVQAPANLQQAQATLQQARANQINALREDKRQRSVDPRATTQTSVDQANTSLRTAAASVESAEAQVAIASLVPQNIAAAEATVRQRRSQLEQSEANLAQAKLNLSYTTITAPFDGYVVRRNVDVGTYAQTGQQMFYFVSPLTWVVANFKETQLDRMRPGQKVDIDVDAYPDLKLHGHVDSIQQGSGARFTTFPTENATGNFVKIVRRVPVKIVIDSGLDQQKGLPLGLSVEPTVYLK